MPIRPEHKHLYPANWRQISRQIRFDRAKGRCERCGVRNYGVGFWQENQFTYIRGNSYWDEYQYTRSFAEACEARDLINEDCESEHRAIVIVLTVAHLNHDPTDNRDENLSALCQRCHLRHDTKQHATSRRLNREKANNQQRLFER